MRTNDANNGAYYHFFSHRASHFHTFWWSNLNSRVKVGPKLKKNKKLGGAPLVTLHLCVSVCCVKAVERQFAYAKARQMREQKQASGSAPPPKIL